jgi:predicted NACHT family NTPase
LVTTLSIIDTSALTSGSGPGTSICRFTSRVRAVQTSAPRRKSAPHRETLALRLNAAVLQSRQLKQLLRKMAHFVALAQGDGEILPALLGVSRSAFSVSVSR